MSGLLWYLVSRVSDLLWFYCICKKTVILVRFEVTLLETKYIAREIVNKRSLSVKNRAFQGPTKTHPSSMSETAKKNKECPLLD